MSDDTTGAAPVAPAAEAAAPASGEGAPAEAPPEAPSFLDVDQYAGHHVRLKVDGEEVQVPLSEALQGYSRTADYTRKTQALAEQQRQAQFGLTLQQALENNPAATLRLLQEQYAVQEQEPEDDSWLDDPDESRWREYDQRVQALEAQRADQELRVALRVLHDRYGDDFDAQAVVSRAQQMNRMDLENIHKELMFDKLWQRQHAEREAQAKRSAEDAARQQAAAELTMHGGSSANGGVAPTGTASTLQDAYFEAKRSLGLG